MADPVDPKYARELKSIARTIDDFLEEKHGHKIGFAILMFEFDRGGEGREGRINYMSNAPRDDMISALKELVARFEGRMVDVPTSRQ